MRIKILITSALVIFLVSCMPASKPAQPTPTSTISKPVLITPTSATYSYLAATYSNRLSRPSTYYPMSTIQVVAVRPGGHELYAYSGDKSDMILVVDINSPDYPVIGKIDLPGMRPNHSYRLPMMANALFYLALICAFEDICGDFGNFVYIAVIDTEKKQVEFNIPMPFPTGPLEATVPSPDGKWLYFVEEDAVTYQFGVAKIDLEKKKVVSVQPLTGANFITISPDGKRLYVTQGCNIYGTWPDPRCQAPNLLSAVDPETSQSDRIGTCR